MTGGAGRHPDRAAYAQARDTLGGTVARLEARVAEGSLLGAQVFVWSAGEVVADFAVGESAPGEPASAADQARLYCAVKPVTATCVGRLVDAGRVALDDEVGSYLPAFAPGEERPITVRQLLSHSSPLPNFPLDVYGLGFHEYVERLCAVRIRPAWWLVRPGYNFKESWHLLAALCETVHGEPFTDVVAREVLDRLPTSRLRLRDPERYRRAWVLRPRGLEAVPGEPADDVLFDRVNPAHGGFGSAADLGRLYVELLRARRGEGDLLSRETVTEMSRTQMETRVRMMGRFTYGLGLVTEPGGDGGWGPGFGHFGCVPRVPVIHAYADPARDAVLVLRFYSVGTRNAHLAAELTASVGADLAAALRPERPR